MPDSERPCIEAVCPNGHHVFREIDSRQSMVFRQDVPLGTRCPICGADLAVKAGSYKLASNGRYLRIGPA